MPTRRTSGALLMVQAGRYSGYKVKIRKVKKTADRVSKRTSDLMIVSAYWHEMASWKTILRRRCLFSTPHRQEPDVDIVSRVWCGNLSGRLKCLTLTDVIRCFNINSPVHRSQNPTAVSTK